MQKISLNLLLETAAAAEKASGLHALANKARRFERNAEITHDVKLVLDVESQHKAEQVIRDTFPEHAILGEESLEHVNTDGYQWIIDPIDGTVNFSHGFPYWCASVAVRFKGKMLAGCIFAPEFNNCYTAHIEAPALKNGEPIRVSKTNVLTDALVFTGLSPNMETPNHPHFNVFKKLIYHSRKIRINGSAALDLVGVAEGACDGYFEAGLHLWDYAAALLIAERAGAKTAIFPHNEGPCGARVLCANDKIYTAIRTLYAAHFPKEITD